MPAVRDLLTPAALPAPVESPVQRRRRRRVVGATLLAGTATLAATLAAPRGSLAFTLLGFLVAAVWLAGTALAGPLTPASVSTSTSTPATARARGRVDEVGVAVALGGVAFLAFLAASVVAREVPVLDGAVDSILGKANAGPTALVLAIAVVNAVAEERFFRGALPLALDGRHRAVVATVVYVLVTVATLNLALVLAGAVMGALFMVERLATGGTLASTVTHVTWSALMLLAFPR